LRRSETKGEAEKVCRKNAKKSRREGGGGEEGGWSPQIVGRGGKLIINQRKKEGNLTKARGSR